MRRERVLRDLLYLAGACVLALGAVYALAPPYWGHDILPHMRWQTHFAAQLAAGHFYPRWLPELNEGFGSPAFFIYPPLAHYVAAAFAWLPGLGPLERVQLSIAVAAASAGLAMYAWLGTLVRRGAALAASLVYVLAPYHLYVDVYRRAALSELWAFVWAPLALLALRSARDDAPRALLLGSAAIAGLLLTHPPSSLVVIPAVVALALFDPAGRRAALVAAAASAFGAALAAIYLLPALTQGPLTNMQVMFIEHMTYQRWLLFGRGTYIGCAPGQHPHACQLAVIIAMQFAAAALLAGAALYWRCPPRLRPMLWGLVAGNVLIAFMLTTWSAPVWETVTVLKKIQFPFRLMVLQGLLLAGLAGLAAEAAAGGAGTKASKLAASLPGVVAGVFAFALIAFAWADRVRGSVGDGLDRPPPVNTREVDEYRLGEVDLLRARFPSGVRAVVASGEATVSVVAWEPRRLALSVRAASPSRIALHHFNYSGWRYAIGGAVRRTEPLSGEMPVAMLEVPAGTHEIELTLDATPAETAGTAVSATAGLAWLALFWRRRRLRGNATKVPSPQGLP